MINNSTLYIFHCAEGYYYTNRFIRKWIDSLIDGRMKREVEFRIRKRQEGEE